MLTVNSDQEDTTKKPLTLLHLDELYPQATCIHVYTDGSQQTQCKMVVLEVYLTNGQTFEAASTTGKYCTNYDVEAKALEQGAQNCMSCGTQH